MDEKYSDEDKLQYEVRKLIAEEKNISRPFWAQPTSWITIFGLALSLAGNTIQFSAAERKQQLAEIKREKIDLETQKLTERESQLTASVNAKLQRLQEASQQYIEVEQRLSSLQDQLNTAKISKDAFIVAVESSAQQIKDINISTAQALYKPLDIARAKEQEGFKALAEGKFEEAQHAFQASENAVSGYHNSYELSRLLHQRLNDTKDTSKRKEIFQIIVSKYSIYAPPELMQNMREMAK